MASEANVFVVDDDDAVRDSMVLSLRVAGHKVEAFTSAKAFLDSEAPNRNGCLVTDIRMPEMDGLELQEELVRRGAKLAVVMVTGHGDVPLAVRAMKAGALDFLEKPFPREMLLASVARALETAAKPGTDARAQEVREKLKSLTPREREVFALVVAGKQSKVVAYELGASPRTIEVHRARMMKKMEAQNLQDLVRMALALGDEFSP